MQHDNGVLFIRLPQPIPELGWSAAQAEEVGNVIQQAIEDDAWRVLLLDFSAGPSPVGELPQPGDMQACARVTELVGGIARPVVAAMHGHVNGFALELGLACDVRMGTDDARYAMNQIAAGCMPFAGATQRLTRLLGMGRAMDLVLTGDAVAATDAQQMGLVQRLVAPELLADEARELARRMAAGAPVAMRYTKEAVLQGVDMTLEQGLRMELDLYLMLFDTQDRTEGITAFQQRRPAHFRGE